MFSDSQLSKNVTGYDRNAKISEIRGLLENIFSTYIKNVSSLEELEEFMRYTDSVFDFVLKEHAIDRDELNVDVDGILEYAEIVSGIPNFINEDSIKSAFPFFPHNVSALVNKANILQTKNTEK